MNLQRTLCDLLRNTAFRDLGCSYEDCFFVYLWEPDLAVLAFLMLIVYGFLRFLLLLKSKNKCTIQQTNPLDSSMLEILHKATLENDIVKVIYLILRCPTAINQPHALDGYTPFMRACLNGNTQMVKLMLSYGANISKRTKRGETPFYLAVFYHVKNPSSKNASCIHTLYHSGSDINAVTTKGYTALDLAVTFGHTALAKWLLNKGAHQNRLDLYKTAILNGHYETALAINKTYPLQLE